MSDSTRPNALQYVRYCCGRRLPDSMRDWVRNDLAGKGAAARMMIRVSGGPKANATAAHCGAFVACSCSG